MVEGGAPAHSERMSQRIDETVLMSSVNATERTREEVAAVPQVGCC